MSLLSISRRVFVGACGSAAAWVLSGGRAIVAPAVGAEAKKRPRPKITISKETTYIEGPLRPDGYPDYLAAVNEFGRKGVTPENNAAIPFWQAVGPKEIPSEVREEYFAMLGMPVPPDDGPYLVSLGDFLPRYKGWKQHGGDAAEDEAWLTDVYKQFDKAQAGPWRKTQFPAIAALLEANATPLNRVVAATRRPRWYSPQVAKDGVSLLHSELIIGLQGQRESTWELRARAMLRLEAGQFDAAWEDVLACHRLGRLMAAGPFAVHRLVGFALDNMASSAAAAIAHRSEFTLERARRCQGDLRALPVIPPMREMLDQSERMYSLDSLLAIAIGGPTVLRIQVAGQDYYLVFGEDKKRQAAYERLASDPRIDWNEALRQDNRWTDRALEAYGRRTYAERDRALDELQKDAEKRSAEAADVTFIEKLSADEAPRLLARRLVEVLLAGSTPPAQLGMMRAEARWRALAQLEHLTFALTAYRHERGSYPPRLANLAPKYIPEVPKDPFTDRELVYKPQKDGYLLYSVGPNQRDDGGRSHMDPEEQKKYENETDPDKRPDDIAIRTPTRE